MREKCIFVTDPCKMPITLCRFGYIVYILEQLLELDRNKSIQRKVVYDIGCKLHQHVEVCGLVLGMVMKI